MLISNKNTIENNIKRLNEFFDLLSPSKQFLQSDKLFNLESVLKNTLTGIIYNQSYEVVSNFNKRSMTLYFKQFISDEDCTTSIKDIFSPNVPFLVIPVEYTDTFKHIFSIGKTIELENDLFVEDEEIPDNYIDFSWNNALYHYATYSFLDHMFNHLVQSIQQSKYHSVDYGDWHHNYFRKEVKFYKGRLIKLGLLSNNESIKDRTKMILTSTEMVYCENSYTVEHDYEVKVSSEFFVHGGDKLERSASMISYKHNKSLRKEISDTHNQLFENHMVK